MCGIAGVINHQGIHLNTLLDTLKHRGPDDQTTYTENNVALVHTRLSIQDVAHGQQPFHHRNFSIIFNGEIYNHLKLRALLPEFSFRTQSDTETLLYLFIKYRFEMFQYLDGMFALCIYDKTNHQLIFARDRAGKKPLYYYKTNERFIFASELNALKKVVQLSVSEEAIHCFLRAGFIWTPSTVYQEVFKLEAATWLTVDTLTLETQSARYFNLLSFYEKPQLSINLEQAVLALEEHLQKSIAERVLASDVEVGVFLSGGIDSNLVVAMASQVRPRLKTFTVKFNGLYDESPLARLTAEKYHTEHIELSVSASLQDDTEKILLAYGEPFMDSSAIPSYYVSREAAKYVKVVLNGDGADELFGGYRRYVPMVHSLTKYIGLISPVIKVLPKPHTKQSLYNYIYRLISMMHKQGLDFYLSATSDVYEDVYTINDGSILLELSQFIEKVFANKKLSSLSKMLYLDFNLLLFCDLLVKIDIATMANSLEGRSPFLSKYLLEFTPLLPDRYKVRGLHTKFILRALAKKYLPAALIYQPKRGFEVPLRKWIDEDLRTPIFDYLKPGCYSETFIKPKFIQALLEKKVNISAEKRAKILWGLFCLEVWHAHE